MDVTTHMNDTRMKIEKSARIADIVLKIARIIGWIIIVMIVLLFGVTCLICGTAGPGAFDGLFTAEEIGDIFLTDSGSVVSGAALMWIYLLFTAVSLTYMGLIMGILIIAGKIFSGIRKTLLPFSGENAKYLKKIAILIGFIAVVPALIEIIGGAILGISMELYSISIEGLVLAFVVYCLAHIFQYGLELQEQADETL